MECFLQVHVVLVDSSGNQMRTPSVRKGTTSPDTAAPVVYVRQPCSVPSGLDCPPGPGLKYCGNIGSNYVDMFLRTDEAGATYFVLTKLLSGSSSGAAAQNAKWSECESHRIYPGMMLQIPDGEQWRGCEAPGRRRALRAAAGLRGSSAGDAQPSSHPNSAVPAKSASNSLWSELVPADRSLAQYAVAPQPGCLAEQPCECCQQNVNCRVPFSTLWPTRARLGDAGDVIISACAYMLVSPCTELPIMAGLAQAPATPAPAATPAAPLQSASGMGTGSRSLLSAHTKQLDDAAGDAAFGDELALQLSAGALPARSLQQLTQDSMDLAVGGTSNTSSSEYRQPLFVASSLQDGLEPDTFYALFAVTEDKVRPTPNLLPAAKQWIFRTQTTDPPSCSISCPSEGASLSSVQLDVQLSSTGTVYYTVQRSSSNSMRNNSTPAQV